MQISTSTLLASQQAAVQHASQPQAKPAAAFAAALEKSEGFQPLPLKQAAAPQGPADAFSPPAKGSQKLGSTIDIKV